MKIEVTQQMIDTPCDVDNLCGTCPVAQALAAATGEQWRVGLSVANSQAGKRRTLHLPTEARDWIWAHTVGGAEGRAKLSPFSFEVEVPS